LTSLSQSSRQGMKLGRRHHHRQRYTISEKELAEMIQDFTELFEDEEEEEFKVHPIQVEEENEKLDQSDEYDTLVIATEWAGSICRIKNCNRGRPVNKNFFNIHGLWPNVLADFRKSPFDCKNTKVTINTFPMDLQSSLNYYWNPMYSTADGFMNHEWSKHGTCWDPEPINYEDVPSDLKKVVKDSQGSMDDDKTHQISYFKTTIAVAQKYNVFAALAAYGIVPNTERYLHKAEILAAITDYFKISKFQIKCEKSQQSNVSYLFEVRLCLDKNYNPMDCKDLRYECPEQIIYPDYA